MTRGAGLVLALLFVAAPARADEMQEIFARGNRAWFAGDFDRAIAEYERLVEAGVADPDVEHNLGTAYASKGRFGPAILHYERALELRPGDDDADRGLRAAQSALGRRRAEAVGEAYVADDPPLGEALVRPFSEAFLAWFLLAVTLVFSGVLLARRYAGGEATRLGLTIAAPFLGLLVLAAGAGLAVRTGAFYEGAPGIVLAEDAPLRDAPDPRARTVAHADEGARVRVLERHGAYARVELPGAREGWMERHDVEAIRR